ncbi:membrane-targeted effector domain-containing toxin [Burkholderia latens]|uniref:membrane-targeted effector domain-containing toxin n=1 Tax=Burkholderia latens TaxID=488446 RepID=UPI00158CB4E2|nr:membrane-targeted effector domain-containing toxin [Burkholderia latens]
MLLGLLWISNAAQADVWAGNKVARNARLPNRRAPTGNPYDSGARDQWRPPLRTASRSVGEAITQYDSFPLSIRTRSDVMRDIPQTTFLEPDCIASSSQHRNRLHAQHECQRGEDNAKATTQAWSRQISDWLTAFDPLVFPAAHARNVEEERNPRAHFWKQQLLDRLDSDIYSNVQVDQTAESGSIPAEADLHPASKQDLTERLADEHIISKFQVARAHSMMQQLRERGELNGTLESCAYQKGEFFDQILNHRGMMTGIALYACLPPGDRESPSVDIVGLPPSIASFLHDYYGACGADRMRMDNDLRDSASLPPVGTSLNVDEAWRATQSALFQPKDPAPLLTHAPPALQSRSIVLRDMDTGIHRAILLELLAKDGLWYPLQYSGGDSFLAAIPGAPSDAVTIDIETGTARFLKGVNGQHDGSFELQVRDESPFVTILGNPAQIRRVCLGSDCFLSYPEVYGGNVPESSDESCPVYVNPLSRTWHPLVGNDAPVHDRSEVEILESVGEPPRRNVLYGRPEHVGTEAGPLYRVIMTGNKDPLEQYDVVEMLGMLIPARQRLAQSNSTLYEIFDRNDLLGECHPIKWNGMRWVFDRDETATPSDNARTQSEFPRHELTHLTPTGSSWSVDTTFSAAPPSGPLAPHESSGSVTAQHDKSSESSHAASSTDTRDATRILRRFFQKWTETFPDVSDMARSKLQTEIKALTGIDVDPDRTYFMRFASAQSDPRTITGWAHTGKPAEERSLTTCMLTNFPASAVEHPWVVDQLSGIYSIKSVDAGRFDATNEIRIRPSQLMKIVREIDFYVYARDRLERAWRMKDLQAIQNAVVIVSNLATPANNMSSRDVSCVLRGVNYLDNKPRVDVYYFDINGYVATDMLVFQDARSKQVVLYLPRSRHALFSFVNEHEMRQWVLESCRDPDRRNDIARHFSLYDRQDGSTYSGVDSWLNTFAQSQRGGYLRNIFGRRTLIGDSDIFRAMAERQKTRTFSDLDIAVKSDSEVDRDRAILYLDAFNTILPNPVTPFVSLGLHMDAAINGDTPEERVAGMAGALADTGNIAFMAVQSGVARIFDGVIEVDSDAFHTSVRDNLRTLSNARTIEWSQGQWVANADSSPHASNELRRQVTLDMYALEVTEAGLTLPDRFGLRSAADGRKYLKVEGRYLKISKWGGASNRYFITGENDRKIGLRFDAGKFRFETVAERLDILFQFGLGGKGSKLSFDGAARAGGSRGVARAGLRGNGPAGSPGEPSDYFEPLSGARHSTHRNGEAVYSATQQDTLRQWATAKSSSHTYKQVSNNNPAFYGNGRLYEVHDAEGAASAASAYSVVEMYGYLVPARENVVAGHASSYEIYDLSAPDKPGLSIEWEDSRWIFEPQTSRQLSTDVLERLREIRPASTNARHLSSPDRMGLRWDVRNRAYLKVDEKYVALKQFRYRGAQRLYGVSSDNAPTMTYAAGAFRLLPGSDWDLAKVPLELYGVPNEMDTFVAMFDHWPSSNWRLRGGLRRADADPRFHEAIVLARRLNSDAKAFFARRREPVRTPDPALAEHATDQQILETLFKNKDGIVFGEVHDRTDTVRALIENIEEFKRLGVTVLYIEGFLADFSGAELESYFSRPGASMPAHTKQWADFLSIGEGLDPNGPYTKRELIRLAHANNIEVRPLDCVGSYFGPFFRFLNYQFCRTRLTMMNYFGAATIVQHRWTKGGGKWIALTGASHINVKYEIPGLAELTDSFGIRVKDDPRSTRSSISPGGTLDLTGSHFDYVWLRPSPRPSTVLSSSNTHLWEDAREPLVQAQLDLYQIPDRPGWRDAMAKKVMEYRGLDRRYADPSASMQEQEMLRTFFRKREALRAAAAEFFEGLAEGYSTSTQLVPLAIEPLQSDASILHTLLSKKEGVVFGESHSQVVSKKLLAENMPNLRAAGVKTLYLEHLLSDIHQADIDAYLQAPDAIMSPKLRAYLDDVSAGNEIDPDGPYTYYTVIEQARRNHINVVALDCTASYKVSDLLSDHSNARGQMINYYASSTISQHQAVLGNAKWVALVGNSHTNTFAGVPGIAELTDTIGVRIEPDDTIVRSKFLPDDGEEVWDLRYGKTSLRADNVWVRPSGQPSRKDL